MNFSRIIQLLLGIIIGVLSLAGTAGGVGYYLFTRLAETPPKPVFSEEVPKEQPVADKASPATPSPTPATAESPKPQPSPEEKKEEKLEPGAYKARVTWPEGLSLRDEPSTGAGRIGGIAFNGELIILKTSDDGKWQQVRIPDSDQVGWVKAGNVEKMDSSGE
ncbi:SH3 domain-containing protein [Lusitaniella coriacea LEGE 07157]|uniref:SH3 domain-containing protein n=1 Tax=Lusitaniella coriacea LEGE 07157 TaxID=945747 RepID=A0A8J7DNS4_9CYAN|nr:SH3 domain-containing protein [Lusitaniella coriacea]MBE9115089.1 SH3 domain-containing protein [Lusitaniella coriacea LEGE 07157]